MTLLGGKMPRPEREDENDPSVDLSLVLKVGAVLGGVGLAVTGLFFGLRKMIGPPREPEEVPPGQPEIHEDLGMTPQGYVPAEGPKSAHEGADLHIEKVVGVAATLAITLVVSILVLLLLFHIFEHAHPGRTSEAAPLVTAAQIPPPPGVVANPGLELEQVRAVEDAHLFHYGWQDPAHTVARIPIERAMTLWVQNYVPQETPAAPAPNSIGASPGTNTAPVTNAALASPGVTELQMRQEKATEAPHAP